LRTEFNTKKYIDALRKKSNDYFHTFITHTSLTGGILLLNPGEEDTQLPHDDDELYYVIYGDGFIKINKKDFPVSEGMVYFVPKQTPHNFFGNTKELAVLYFFGGPDN